MDLQEEYFARHKLDAPFIRYVDKAQLILRGKKEAAPEYNWLNVSLECRSEGNHPAFYQVVVAGNPVIYATPDFSHFSFHHERTISDQRWEWDQYELNLLEWAKHTSQNYEAINGSEAMPVCWQMFLANYDGWFANFLPHRLFDALHFSLTGGKQQKWDGIGEVEEWMKERHERVWSAWNTIRRQLESRGYADWLANLVNR